MPKRPEREEPRELLTPQQVAERLSISTRTLWRMLAREELPPPIRYTRKLVRWKAADIAAYLERLTPG
jgi:excisionase family DNA binding protein